MIKVLYNKAQEIIENIDKLLLTEDMEKKPAIVYDIDNTLIDSKGYALDPIIKTYHYAKTKGFLPFLVTARQAEPETTEATIYQLASIGIENNIIYFLPVGSKNVARYKTLARKDINRNHKVAMSIGDSHWDFGQYGGIGIHIPWSCDCSSLVEFMSLKIKQSA